MSGDLEVVLHYHQSTKHHFQRYARGPGFMDWATQPDPFRRYHGAPLVRLDRTAGDFHDPLYDDACKTGTIAAAPLHARSISWLFWNSLALSAWKRAGENSWALRVNPSSGNLHPTEGYLLSGPVQGLSDEPGIFHYAPREHALERRAVIPEELWVALMGDFSPESFLIGLTSIHWREAWKYGERAYRYCQLDAGHAIAALALAASGLGWRALLVDSPATEDVSSLLGLSDNSGPEGEHADVLILVQPRPQAEAGTPRLDIARSSLRTDLSWQGTPNQLSPGHVRWEIIDAVARACRKPPTKEMAQFLDESHDPSSRPARPDLFLSRLVRQRRSAVSMDGVSRMPSAAFFRMLRRAISAPARAPHSVLPWSPKVHLVLFVHRVDGLNPGLYLLPGRIDALPALREAMRPDFLWKRPESCPDGLHLLVLVEGDFRQAAMQLSCHQDIAGDGCFCTAMIAEFDGPLRSHGPWFYPRLFWECGLIGQVIYLEAEAARLRATGIGCYFDDPTHRILGLKSTQFQDLYHLTVGGPVEDNRLSTLPAYPA